MFDASGPLGAEGVSASDAGGGAAPGRGGPAAPEAGGAALGTVLIVEDDPNVARTNRRILERAGFSVLSAATLKAARELLEEHAPDALVLDIMLPDGSGLELCEQIRHTTASPVLFLTALDEKSDVIAGLTAGGNDYITKPYDIDEFAARVRSLVQLARDNRRRSEQASCLSAGPITLDPVAQQALVGGVDLQLTPKDFALLYRLIAAAGQPLTPEQLYESIWKQPMIDDSRAIRSAIYRLRLKLEGSGHTITTRRGEGYRFTPED